MTLYGIPTSANKQHGQCPFLSPRSLVVDDERIVSVHYSVVRVRASYLDVLVGLSDRKVSGR